MTENTSNYITDLPGLEGHSKPNSAPIELDRAKPSGKTASGKLRLMALADLDGRTNAAKAALSLRDAIISDLGGEESLSSLKIELVNTVAVQTALLNDAHARILSGDMTATLADLATLTNTRNRTAAMVKLDKLTKELTLESFLSDRQA